DYLNSCSMSAFALIDSVATEVVLAGQIVPEKVEHRLRELEAMLFEPAGRELIARIFSCLESARANPSDTARFLNAMDELGSHLEKLNDARAGQTRARHGSSWLKAVSLETPELIEYDTTQSGEVLDTFFAEYIV